MFLKGKNTTHNQTVINIPCSCGTHSINISYFDDDMNEIFLTFYIDRFYIQKGIFETICSRFKQAFMALCGKSYRFEEIAIEKEDLEKLEQEFNNILNKFKEEEK